MLMQARQRAALFLPCLSQRAPRRTTLEAAQRVAVTNHVKGLGYSNTWSRFPATIRRGTAAPRGRQPLCGSFDPGADSGFSCILHRLAVRLAAGNTSRYQTLGLL